MLRFEGDKQIRRPPAEVWRQLADARFLIQCIPDVDHVSKAELDEAVLVIRPGLAFMRGKLDVAVRIFDRTETVSLRVQLVSKGIGSSSTVETALSLADKDGGTLIHWSAEVKELTGLLRLVPSGLIRGAAQKVIGDVWDRAEKQLMA